MATEEILKDMSENKEVFVSVEGNTVLLEIYDKDTNNCEEILIDRNQFEEKFSSLLMNGYQCLKEGVSFVIQPSNKVNQAVV